MTADSAVTAVKTDSAVTAVAADSTVTAVCTLVLIIELEDLCC